MIQNSFNKIYLSGIAGSGMFPLAFYLKKKSLLISGSDRYFDKNLQIEKKKLLKDHNIKIYPEDSSGIKNCDILIRSSAVEDNTAVIKKAREYKKKIIQRSEFLADIVNNNKTIAIAGTSGKSTITLLLGHIFKFCGRNPAVLAGAELTTGSLPELGDGPLIVEIDESDGNLDLYKPHVSLISNISTDHFSLDILIEKFRLFCQNSNICYLNSDSYKMIGYGERYSDKFSEVQFLLNDKFNMFFKFGKNKYKINSIGNHNIKNAISAIILAKHYGLKEDRIKSAIKTFPGLKRRLQYIGKVNNTTLVDDFAHNKAKIDASLKALKRYFKKIYVIFRPHGYSPIKNFGEIIASAFCNNLTSEDYLLILPVYYTGGTTVSRQYNSDYLTTLIKDIKPDLNIFTGDFNSASHPFDKFDVLVTMGARDPSLSKLIEEIKNGKK